jgi:hypothetical protein
MNNGAIVLPQLLHLSLGFVFRFFSSKNPLFAACRPQP